MGCSSSSEVVEPANKPTNKPPAQAATPANRPANRTENRQENPAPKTTPKAPAPKYKLIYFDMPGRGEIIRLIFVAGGLKFEDVRVSHSDWAALKPETPLGQVPLLEVNGSKVPLVQSVAIARYVANEAGIAGKNSVDKAKADAVVDTASEILEAFINKIWFGIKEDTPNVETIMEEFKTKDIAKIMNNLIVLLKSYGSDGFFVGNELTWADMFVYQTISLLNMKFDGFLSAYPELENNRQQIKKNERVKEYLAKQEKSNAKSE